MSDPKIDAFRKAAAENAAAFDRLAERAKQSPDGRFNGETAAHWCHRAEECERLASLDDLEVAAHLAQQMRAAVRSARTATVTRPVRITGNAATVDAFAALTAKQRGELIEKIVRAQLARTPAPDDGTAPPGSAGM